MAVIWTNPLRPDPAPSVAESHSDLFASASPLRHLALPANHIDMPSLPPWFDPTETPPTTSLALIWNICARAHTHTLLIFLPGTALDTAIKMDEDMGKQSIHTSKIPVRSLPSHLETNQWIDGMRCVEKFRSLVYIYELMPLMCQLTKCYLWSLKALRDVW